MLNIRDYAAYVFNSLNENQLIDFLHSFADDNTLARFESGLIAAGAERKRYAGFEEILQEIEQHYV